MSHKSHQQNQGKEDEKEDAIWRQGKDSWVSYFWSCLPWQVKDKKNYNFKREDSEEEDQ